MNKSLILRILSLVFAAVMLLSLAACGGDDGKASSSSTASRQDTVDGTDTAENDDDAKILEQNADGLYMIASADDLLAFRDLVDEEIKAKIGRGNDTVSEVGAILTADIDISELCGEGIGNWRPIGITLDEEGYDVIGYYGGTFDGNGHSISGLYIKTEDSGGGFFGVLQNATVSNLTFKNCTLDCKYGLNEASGIKDSSFGTGAVAMYMKDGLSKIINCATDENSTVKGIYSVGGLVGLADNIGGIESCKNYASVSGSASGSENALVGGIVGRSNGKVYGCINYGDVVNSGGSASMGGIAGYSSGKIYYCINAGSVKANGGAAYVITDFSDGYGEWCINIGNVIDSAIEDEDAYKPASYNGFNLEPDAPELTDGTLLEKLGDEFWVQGEKFPVWSGKLPY